MKTFRLMTCSLLPMMALLWLPSSSGAKGPCGCTKQDQIDIISRMKVIETAMQEYVALSGEWKKREKSLGEPVLLTPELRKSAQDSVEFKMRAVKDPKAFTYGSDTDGTCKVTIDPAASACLRRALEDHEAVHKQYCDANDNINPLVDWRAKQRVVAYLNEEMDAYAKEHVSLQRELALMALCSLKKGTK